MEKIEVSSSDPIFTPSELFEFLVLQGKTSIVKQVREFLNCQLIITHPVTKDPTDYQGCPTTIINKDGEKNGRN